MNIKYIAYPDAILYKAKDCKEVLKQLLWGDKCEIKKESKKEVQVSVRGTIGWLKNKEEQLQEHPIMEINFVDVGQGDGCHIHTPGNKVVVIDAGKGYEMYNFLAWRYNNFKDRAAIHAAIISHPDQDHYGGFAHFYKPKHEYLSDKKIKIKNLLHNSIVDRGSEKIGKVPNKDLTELISGYHELKGLIAKNKKGKYLEVMEGLSSMVESPKNNKSNKHIFGIVSRGEEDGTFTLANGRRPEKIKNLSKLLSKKRGSVRFNFKVIAPIPRREGTGNRKKRYLPFFNNSSKTKNGHSIVIMLEVANKNKEKVRILLGGDLNKESQEYLMEDYERKRMGGIFSADVAKACHHGSSEVSPDFMRIVCPIATVVSSGDKEPHCHPRPDTLGLIGKTSRGDKPLIFSTELARPNFDKFGTDKKELKQAIESHKKDKEAQEYIKAVNEIRSLSAAYGTITVLTDGSRIMIAQRNEMKNLGSKKAWDLFAIERKKGKLEFVGKPRRKRRAMRRGG